MTYMFCYIEATHERVFSGRTLIWADSPEQAWAIFRLGQPDADVVDVWH